MSESKQALLKEPRRTQAERTKASDQRMFDATVKLIVERGPSATSLTEVGVLAGYSRGLASHRFGSKDRLFNFVVLRLSEIWLAKLTEVTANKVGMAAIEQAVEQHYQFCVDSPDYARTLYILWFESLNSESELSDTIKSIHQRRFQDVVNWVLHDQTIPERVKREADVLAAQFSASVIGIVYYWLANPEKNNETKGLHEGLRKTMARLLNEKKTQ